MIIVNVPFSVEILVEPSVYFAQELDEAIQVIEKQAKKFNHTEIRNRELTVMRTPSSGYSCPAARWT